MPFFLSGLHFSLIFFFNSEKLEEQFIQRLIFYHQINGQLHMTRTSDPTKKKKIQTDSYKTTEKTRSMQNQDHKAVIKQASFMQTRKTPWSKNKLAEQIQTDGKQIIWPK